MARDRISIARVYLTAGRLEPAEIELERALAISPDDLDALSLLGRVKHMRGELTDAIQCWSVVRARSPHQESALLCLGALQHLAADPARSRSELSVLDEQRADRRHLVHLEVERALRLFLEARPEESLRLLDRVARREGPRDRDLYKLAVFTRAWIEEALGQVDRARATLEALGDQTGFGADLDRLLFLGRMYERATDPVLLERAAQVYEFLEKRIGKTSLLGKLAILNDRLGRPEVAQGYRERQLAAFERRMGKPTIEEALAASSLFPVPLADLRCAVFGAAPAAAVAELERRDRVVLALIEGTAKGARERLEEICGVPFATASDWALLGDVRAEAGEPGEAVTAYLVALEHEIDVEAQVEIFERLLRTGGLVAAREAALRLAPLERTRPLTEALRRRTARSPLDPQAWRRLALFEDALALREAASRHEARAVALEGQRASVSVGHVQTAAAYYLLGRPKGLIHEVWAAKVRVARGEGGQLDDGDMLGSLAHDLRALVKNVFDATRVYALRRFPERCVELSDHRYRFKVTKEDEPSSGESAGLPCALAFLSVFLELPIRQDVAFTGAIVTEAAHRIAVRRVGDVEPKIVGAVHRGMSAIVVPAENRSDVEGGALVPPSVAERSVRYVRHLDDAVVEALGVPLSEL